MNNDIINEENKEYSVKNNSNALDDIKKINTFNKKNGKQRPNSAR